MNDKITCQFFENLARYYWHENDLSNITVALCNASESFKKIFLHFFFDSIDVSNVTDINREVWDQNGAGSRVDIHISTKTGSPYIIEVKIYDSNHHPEYSSNYKVDREHYGYITNYKCKEYFPAIFKTWGEFYDNLTQKSDELDTLSKAYMSYLKTVCNINRYDTPMNLSNINSLGQFLNTVDQIIETNQDINSEVKLVAYKKTDLQTAPLVIARRYGICSKSDDWLLNGYIYIDVEQPAIGFSTNGDMSVMKALEAVMTANSTCWGYPARLLTLEEFGQFKSNDISLETQINILTNRLKEFIDRIVEVLKDTKKI